MGPIGVWGPHDLKGWWTGLMGQPHHSPKGPMRVGLEPKRGGRAGHQTLTPRAAGLGATPPLAAGPRRGWGAAHMAPYIRRCMGGGTAP